MKDVSKAVAEKRLGKAKTIRRATSASTSFDPRPE